MMKHDISIIIPTYNRYELLLHSIRSVLRQQFKQSMLYEIIVVNDCSTDPRYYSGELEKIANVSVIHLPINQKEVFKTPFAHGMVREIGIKAAKGEWIAFLDDDDVFSRTKLDLQIKKMISSGTKMCCTNMYRINHQLIEESELHIELLGKYFDRPIPNIIKLHDILTDNLISTSTVIIHRSIIEAVGSFKPVKYEDWDFWKRSLQFTDCCYIDDPLVLYTENVKGGKKISYYG